MLKLFVCAGMQAETKAGFQKRSDGERSRPAANARPCHFLSDRAGMRYHSRHNSAKCVLSMEALARLK